MAQLRIRYFNTRIRLNPKIFFDRILARYFSIGDRVGLLHMNSSLVRKQIVSPSKTFSNNNYPHSYSCSPLL